MSPKLSKSGFLEKVPALDRLRTLMDKPAGRPLRMMIKIKSLERSAGKCVSE
jgi:hypothetical protein